MACTGLHGANRLASNSLLEALVFARRGAAEPRCARCDGREPPTARRAGLGGRGDATDSDEAVVITQNWDEIRRFMWNYVGHRAQRPAPGRGRATASSLLQEEITDVLLELRT